MTSRLVLVVYAALATSGPVVAQPVAAPGGPESGLAASPAAPEPVDCAPRASVYQAAKGPKIWVLRQGRMALAENPLRPLSRDEALVLEVVVNNRRATAVGPDALHLQQGGSPKTVERDGREPIRWADAGLAAPALRVVAEDGRVLLGPMAFGGCEDAPAAKAVADAPAKPEASARRKKGTAAGPTGPLPGRLPQGALDGLSMPKR